MASIAPDRWQRLDALLDEALAYAPAERVAFLRTACGGDLLLYREACDLLETEANAAALIGDSATEFARPLLIAGESDSVLQPGEHVGPYRIEAEVGRGGMGVVYRATRADGAFDKTVALKLVKRGMDTDEVLARFRRERQVLAALDHPAIARLLDGGAADDGRPYLAMEFIEGVPITAYCDRHGLDLGARLALFERVGEAVAHAHRRLVVHRDLKPSNVLVAEEDGKPQVKLLDFGIARLLDSDLDDDLTQAGARRLTPAYAAPELLRGEAVTTAADVYALGVVLYELLTGQRPETPAKPPSAVANADTARRLRGDLDVICLKALREEMEARYASVEALTEDLRRHRAGLLVQARPASVGYRVRKFVGRHRIGVVSTVLVVAALFTGLGTALWQAQEKARQAERADRARDFALNLFNLTDPNQTQGQEVTADELLDQGAERALDELADDPEVQAQMLRGLGNAYLNLGRYDQAEPLLDRALALSRTHLGDTHPDLAAALAERASLAYHVGDYALADALDLEALEVLRRHFGYEHERVADVLAALAVNQSEQGAYARADSLFREALALHQRTGTAGQPDAVATLRNFAALRYREGDYAAADSLYGQALAWLRSLYGENHTQIALTLDNLGVLRYMQGGVEAALEITREALAMWQHLLGDDHPSTLVSTSNLASFLMVTGDLEESETLHRHILSARREQLGDAHPDIAATLHNLAAVLGRQDRYGEARSLLREALVIQREALGEAHPRVAQSLNSLAQIERLRGDLSAAEASYREALAMRRELLGERHPDVALTQLGLADVLAERRSFEAAEPLYREALAICVDALGEAHSRTQQARASLAQLYEAWGRPADAARHR